VVAEVVALSVYIISPGRSGSGWLTTLLAGCGLSALHEWHGTVDNPDVVADTSFLWLQDDFLKTLAPNDVCVVLDRDETERTASVKKLLGERDWAYLEKAWIDFKEKLKKVPNTTVWIDYKDLFSRETKEKLFQMIYYHTGASTGNFSNMWDLLRHMRVTNATAEREVVQSYMGDMGND